MNVEDSPNQICLCCQKLSYGLGHVFNDLCAAMWFSYTLFYFQVVLKMEATTAGILLMTGQVVDSLATPLAGWLLDCTGKRKLWHFSGSLAVALGFSLIFSMKYTDLTSDILIYYILNITLFQIGWAIVQISHLSLIPEISRSHAHSSDLTAIRYTASVCCNMTVYLVTLFILQQNVESQAVGPRDFYKFKEIALIITFIGILSSMFFYCGLLGTYSDGYETLREPEDVNNLNDNNRHFLKSVVMYTVALMYMASRLFTILNLIYMPLYIDERSTTDQTRIEQVRETIATVPLVSYIASFLTSILLKYKNGICNDKIIYAVGTFFGLLSSILIGIGVPTSSDSELYIIAVLIGISGSTTMVASLCLTANFVKTNGHGGGMIYSIVTFTDKLISGAVVLLVQNMQCTPRSLCPHFYENVLSYVCGVVSIIGLSSMVTLEVKTNRH
ncbi:unnamed protein product [Callosobruchus maculatus]|uniref:Major facilitator superfamily (MFS) profile domain-containing protein n=2 Tax=Callosobruchus maculatus TaxID=64391 RepID=A0A653BWZ5_CALMS|nr:unnamed protein product [Callosobruchus maculatus]